MSCGIYIGLVLERNTKKRCEAKLTKPVVDELFLIKENLYPKENVHLELKGFNDISYNALIRLHEFCCQKCPNLLIIKFPEEIVHKISSIMMKKNKSICFISVKELTKNLIEYTKEQRKKQRKKNLLDIALPKVGEHVVKKLNRT